MWGERGRPKVGTPYWCVDPGRDHDPHRDTDPTPVGDGVQGLAGKRHDTLHGSRVTLRAKPHVDGELRDP